MTDRLHAARVWAPASTSNLGPGFDTLGLALDRGVEMSFRPGGEGFRVQRSGTLPPELATKEDLAVQAFLAAVGARGIAPAPAGLLRVESSIPVGRGLGSSAAARVAGAMVGHLVRGREPVRRTLLEQAARAEGHPDNAAPAVLGGFVASVSGPEGLTVASLPLSPAVGLAFAEPGVPVHTEDARRALPSEVPHAVAARTAGRLAVLIHGLAVADPSLIRVGLEDELHVPFRLPLVPGGEAAMKAAREAGAWGVTLSGSGSGLLAFCPREDASDLASTMAEAFRSVGQEGATGFPLRPDPLGARRLPLDHP